MAHFTTLFTAVVVDELSHTNTFSKSFRIIPKAYNNCLLVNNVTIKLRRHANLSLTVLTDMHAGGVIAESHIESAINTASHLNTDAVVIVGDLVDGSVDEIGERIRSLTKLRRPVIHTVGRCIFS